MHLQRPHDDLVRCIKSYAQSNLESRQVARRLRDLLQLRFSEIRREYWDRLHNVARAERYALIDERYQQYVEEIVSLTAQARQSRIQYETHLMLVQARQSLRHFRKT